MQHNFMQLQSETCTQINIFASNMHKYMASICMRK